jgi:tetratricopeptide (TPR) repeat protein
MASVYVNQGDYSKALEWYGRALVGREKSLGKDHLETLASVNNIASVYVNEEDYSKALEWFCRALVVRVSGWSFPSDFSLPTSARPNHLSALL